MLNIFFFIVILFMCVALPTSIFLPIIVSEINTGGNLLFVFIAIGFIAICITIAVVFYRKATKKPDPTPEEEKQEFAWIDDMKKTKIANALGGEGAKVTIKLTEEVVTEESTLTELEQKAIENKSLNTGEINWTVTSSEGINNSSNGYSPRLTKTDKAIVSVKRASNKVKTTLKIIGLIVLVGIEFLFLFGTIRKLTVFGNIYVNDISIKSLSNVAGYYVNCSSSSKSFSYGDEPLYNFRYSYSTNKKTDELYNEYNEYLADNFSYHIGTNSYYLIDPKHSDRAYIIELSKDDKELDIYYSYQTRPHYMY